MKCFKYIIFETRDGLSVPVIFSKLLAHESVRIVGKPVSAGFIRFANGRIECYGRSATLELKSRGEVDLQIILDDYSFYV